MLDVDINNLVRSNYSLGLDLSRETTFNGRRINQETS